MRVRWEHEAPPARVVEVELSDLQWSYNEKPPSWRTQPMLDQYGRSEDVDPWWPCYTHHVAEVSNLLRECVEAAPLGDAPVSVYIAPWEGLARTNGWSTWDHPYRDDREWRGPGLKPWEGIITLSGKRIEIHPAITRYLVAHEYGHLVDAAIAQHRYPGDSNAFGKLHEDYGRMRRVAKVDHYGAGTHHLDVGEVLANDFRTVVLGREREFWRHPVTPGWKLKTVQRWWDAALDDLRSLAA